VQYRQLLAEAGKQARCKLLQGVENMWSAVDRLLVVEDKWAEAAEVDRLLVVEDKWPEVAEVDKQEQCKL
jgi:hypothetical protein